MQTRITSIGKRIPLELSMSIRPVVKHRSQLDRLADVCYAPGMLLSIQRTA